MERAGLLRASPSRTVSTLRYDSLVDEDSWWALDGAEQQLLQQADYAAQAVLQLPDYMGDSDLPSPLYFAVLDSFLMNLRLLVDFWGIREHKRDSRDFYAADFIADWTPGPGDAVQRLREDNWWQMASEQVAHLSRRRVVPDPHDEAAIRYDTSVINLRSIANDVRSIENMWLRSRRAEIAQRVGGEAD
jgi:hypothetical protein